MKTWKDEPPSLTPIPMSFFHTTKQFFDTSWVSHNSAQLRHCLPKNQMLPATRLPPSDTNHKAGLSPKLLTSPLNNRLEDSTTSSLGSINLAERLTGLRETFYFRAYWFIIKGYNLGRVRKKRYTRQSMWESVRSSHALWTSLSPNLHVVKTRRSPNSILLDFKGGFID